MQRVLFITSVVLGVAVLVGCVQEESPPPPAIKETPAGTQAPALPGSKTPKAPATLPAAEKSAQLPPPIEKPEYVLVHQASANDLGMEERPYNALRAIANLVNEKKLDEALAKLESGERWFSAANEKGHSAVKGVGLSLAIQLLHVDKTAEAQRALSAAGRSSLDPSGYLYELRVALPWEYVQKLWPDRPYLVVADPTSPNARPMVKWAEQQGREMTAAEIDDSVARSGSASFRVDVSKGSGTGMSWYGIPVDIPLIERPCAVRGAIREQTPTDGKIVLGYWFQGAGKSAATMDAPAKAEAGGWEPFDIRRDFYSERKAWADTQDYSIEGGIINRVGVSLPSGGENTVWFDRVEIYIP